MNKQIPPFGLRLPPEVKEHLEKLAEENRRSLNAEIIVRLEQSIRQEGKSCIEEERLRLILKEELTRLGKAG